MTDAETMPVGDHPSFRNERFPMSLFEPHKRQAEANHYQSLTRLAERGGLSWCEALAILEDRKYLKLDLREAEKAVRTLLTEGEGKAATNQRFADMCAGVLSSAD